MNFGNSFVNGIGNAVDEIDRICTNIMIVIIIIQAAMVLLSFWYKKKWFRITLRVFSILFGLLTIFCFQHEVGLYKTGGVLLFLAVVGFGSSFFRN